MLSQFDKEELVQLKVTSEKLAALQELKDKCMGKQNELTKERDRCVVITSLIAGQEFQELLDSTALRAQEFQTVQQDYEQLPASSAIRIEKLQFSNQCLELQVWDLQQRIIREREREELIEQSLQTCEKAVD
jgi:hypothetical protein